MTIKEAIEMTDGMKPNMYTLYDKIKWLSDLDMSIKTEIIDTHEGDAAAFLGYTPGTDVDTELLISSPFDEIYLRWLEARIDYANAEYSKYNNSITAYNAAFSAYERYYNRTHMPKGKKITLF